MCHRGIFSRKYKNFKTISILPHIDDSGLHTGTTQLYVDKKNQLLNRDANKTIGIAENNSQLVENMINVNEDYKREYEEYAYQPTPCAETIHFYQLLMANDDGGLYLVKQDRAT